VIVHDLDIFSASVCPTEAQAELIVYPDALLPGAITFQGFESIAGRHPQIVQSARDLQLPQFASRHVCDVREPTDSLASRKSLRVGALERLDHEWIVTWRMINVKRDYLNAVDGCPSPKLDLSRR
jgi:hypothetical protein